MRPNRRIRPNAGFATRSCFNRHDVPPQKLRTVQISGASILVCSEVCEAQARERIEGGSPAREPHPHRGRNSVRYGTPLSLDQRQAAAEDAAELDSMPAGTEREPTR